MASPKFVFPNFCLQWTYEFLVARILHVILAAQEVIQRLDFFSDKLLYPVEFFLKFRFGFKVPRHKRDLLL
jgi:hypothetical protein